MQLTNSKSNWLKLPLNELCEVNIGKTPSRDRPDYWGQKHLWLSIADMNQGRNLETTKERITDLAARECNCRLAEIGTILLSFKLSIGKVGIAKTPLFHNEAIAALPIRDKSKLLPDYLYWALQSIDLSLGLDRAAMGLTLNKAKLLNLKIPLPPIAEQKRIAEILDRTQSLISKRKEAIAKLNTLTQSIFLEMFGDPDLNPKEWEVNEFSSQIKSVRYGTGSPPIYSEEGIPFIRATNVKEGTVKLKDMKRISLEESNKIAKCQIKFGDLIVVRSGVNTGDCAMISREYDGAYAAFDLIVELPLTNAIFYNFLINSAYGKSYLAPLTRRAAQPHLNAEQLKNLRFISPPMPLKEEFAQRVEAVEKLKATHRASLSQLQALFASLQHRAFRGEL